MPSPVKSLTEPPCSLTARGHQFVDRLDQRERAFFAQPLGNRGEADHVREQHRHLPPLARGRGGSGRSRGGVAHFRAPSVQDESRSVPVSLSLDPSLEGR